jgi:hypothetical protein
VSEIDKGMYASKEAYEALFAKVRPDAFILYKAAERASETFVQSPSKPPIQQAMERVWRSKGWPK